MIVNIEESLYDLVEARSDVIVLKSKISGEEEYWVPTKDENGVYLISYKGKHFKYSESTSHEPKKATINAIRALGSLRRSLYLNKKADHATRALLTVLASLEEPVLANGNSESGISAEDWLKIANEKGLWTALSEIPYDPGQTTRTDGALASYQDSYHKLKADFLRLAQEPDRPILDKLGEKLFDCILGECDMEVELDKLSDPMKKVLPGFRSEIENLKRSILKANNSAQDPDPLENPYDYDVDPGPGYPLPDNNPPTTRLGL